MWAVLTTWSGISHFGTFQPSASFAYSEYAAVAPYPTKPSYNPNKYATRFASDANGCSTP
jgi:hypothetical protein